LGGVFGTVTENEALEAVHQAIEVQSQVEKKKRICTNKANQQKEKEQNPLIHSVEERIIALFFCCCCCYSSGSITSIRVRSMVSQNRKLFSGNA
jgi:hypothetical protein